MTTPDDVTGTAAGLPTAGVEVDDAHGVTTGTDLPEPYPERPGNGTPAPAEPPLGRTPNGGYPT